MKKLYSILMLVTLSTVAVSGSAIAGGEYGHDGHQMASGTAGSGVHFYGRIYVGFDRNSSGAGTSTDGLRDDGQKSRLGIKFKEGMLVGKVEYKFDIGDGDATGDSKTCSATLSDCRTINLHVGNLGLATPLGYIGAGTFESPYKTFGQYDTNMDTAVAMNRNGAQSDGNFGIAGTWESALSYHAKMGPVTLAYMYGMSDRANAGIQSGDYSYGIKFNDFLVSGLEFGVAATHDNEEGGGGNSGAGNKKVFASYKVMPGLGVFYSEEDTELAGGTFATNGDGEILTVGTHYTMGNKMIQFALTQGDANLATEDYKTISLSLQNNLSKNTDVTFGYSRKGFESTGGSTRNWGIGITHSF